MADVVGSPVHELAPADCDGVETEHALLASSAREECSDGDASGPASGKPTGHAEVVAAVKKQVEFYFSDANLPTDKHLLKQIQKDAEGYVPLRMIANFKRVKALSKDLAVVAEALRGSTLLSLDSDGSRVRRAAPLPSFDVQDITRRTVVVEHLPDKPTIESVTQLLAQYGRVVMVRICSRGNTSKLPAWLAKAVDSMNVTMASGEFALVEFGSEDDCVACVTKTKNPDNWRTSLRVRHLLTNFKPSAKASGSGSGSTGSRPRSSLDHNSRHEAEAAGHIAKSHGREREHSGTGDGRRTTPSRRSSHDGSKRASHDGQQQQQQQQHKEDRRRQDAGSSSGSAAAAVAAADLPVHLSPIRTHAAGTAAQQQQRSASPYANGAARMNGASPALSPVKTGTSGVGGCIGSPRTVPSPAPASVTSFIDSILSAPTASTPTREARSSAGGGVEGRWGGDWGAGSSSGAGSMTPAAAVAAALAGVSTPPQSGSPRHSASGGGAGSSRASQSGGFGAAAAAAPTTPTRLSVASGSGSSHSPLAVQQGVLAAQLAAAAAAAAQAAMAGSPRAVQGSRAANWRSASTSAAGASISAPTTPLAALSAGDAVAEALESLGLGGDSSSSSRAIPVGSPDLGSSPKPAPWVPASRLQHMQQAAAHGDARGAMRSSGSEAEDNTAGSWRSSWTGQAGSPLGGSHMRPPKHRTSGSGGASQSGGKQRRRSWHAAEGEVDAAALASSSGGRAGEGNSNDGSASKAASGGGNSSGRRSRLAQQGGDVKFPICAITEASGELEALVAASEAGSGSGGQQRRRSSNTGHDAGNAGAASSSRDAGEEQDDEHEDGEHEHGKRRRRRHRGSGSRRGSLDEPHPSAGGGGSRRQSLDEGSRGGSRRQSLDESGPRHGGGPSSRVGALSPAPGEAPGSHSAHSRTHSSCSGGGSKAHSRHGSPSPASRTPGERRPSHDGAAAKEGSKKKDKKDYASWAAATPEFRAAAKHSGGGGSAASSGSALGSSPARAGLSPMRASGGGAAGGHDGDSHVRIARMPDGTRGFGMGRGRALTPAPL